MISRFFIARPILANVIALLFVLIGAVSVFNLPVAQYPNVVPPTVTVTTSYPGASAQTIVDTVALPIEQQVNGVAGMIYMQSQAAADGSYNLTVSFEIGTDPNMAQVLVQNRVSAALAQLPTAVQAQGVTTQIRSSSILQIVTLGSTNPRHDGLFLANYATINLMQELARLPGVGQVRVFGAAQYAMRIWLDPDQMQARSLVPQDVITALQQQNQQVAAGQLGMQPVPSGQAFQITLNILGRLEDVSQFEDIVIKAEPGGRFIRIRDVGRVELGAQSYSQTFNWNGRASTGLGIFQLPGANALEVAAQVKATMDRLAVAFPEGMSYAIPFDTTIFVKASVHEVYVTLAIAGVLVLAVILLFLQDWRATLVPATTVPVTIIGAFAAMAALGFTINLSTLFAIVLAIGIVVDDAIVVVESAAHHIEKGEEPHIAAGKAMDELFGPIIGITLVLMAVFLPAAFLPGLTGQMYRQFALVIAATALISAINAATLKPTQCAMWLRPATPPEKRNLFCRMFNRGFGVIEAGYTRIVTFIVRHARLSVLLALGLIGLAGWGLTRIPTAFIPTEDQGYLLVSVQLPDGASLERTQRALSEVEAEVKAIPGVAQTIVITGVSVLDNSATMVNAGVVYAILDDWSLRPPGSGKDLRALYPTMLQRLGGYKDAEITVLPPPPIQGIGNASGFSMMVELRDGVFDWTKLQRLTDTIVENAASQSAINRVFTTFRAEVQQLRVDVDRVQAEALQVGVADVFSTIQSYLGSTYVNQFNRFGRTFQVYVQADGDARVNPDDIGQLHVRNRQGQMVPVGALASWRMELGPSLINLYNLYPAAMISGIPAEGFSSGEVMALMEQIGAHVLPPGTGYDWTALSYQEAQVGSQMYLIFALALVLVYMVLAGQYESWLAPVGVILAVPLALLGTAGALIGLGLANNLYTQIGLVLLVALGSKNAILIVEVARELRAEGMEIEKAAIEAARRRFRPIIMTSLAFILGVVPLVMATGAGASARGSIGIAVLSGMLANTCLAVLFVPAFFTVLQRWEERKRKAPKPAVEKTLPG
jgi:HAE1 family hydrophobic/amphiphilic exporter-1